MQDFDTTLRNDAFLEKTLPDGWSWRYEAEPDEIVLFGPVGNYISTFRLTASTPPIDIMLAVYADLDGKESFAAFTNR